MKIHLLLLIFGLIGLIQTARSQNFTFAYDNAGNRYLKDVVTLKSTESVHNDPTQKQDTARYQELLGELRVILYPNPTRGRIIIELQNLDPTNQSEVFVTDNSGKVLYKQKGLQQSNEIDLSSFNPGMYFLNIHVGTVISEWKVIKE